METSSQGQIIPTQSTVDVKKASPAVLWASGTILIVLLLMPATDYFIFCRWLHLHDGALSFMDWDSGWATFAAFGYVLTMGLFVAVGVTHYHYNNSIATKRCITGLGFFACLELFLLIGASGGVVSSPFTTFYAAVLSAAALVGRKSKHIGQLLLLMIVLVLVLFYLQFRDWLPNFRSSSDPNAALFYDSYYILSVIGTLVATFLADRTMDQ